LESIATGGPPEFIYYPVFSTLGAEITKQAREIDGLEDTILAASDGIQSSIFVAVAGDAAEGVYASGANLIFNGETYDSLLVAYEGKYGTQPTAPFHAHAFDAANIIFNAIEQIAEKLEDGTLIIGRQALRDALFATSNYQGVTGILSCNAYGDCAGGEIVINQVQNGRFETIWP